VVVMVVSVCVWSVIRGEVAGETLRRGVAADCRAVTVPCSVLARCSSAPAAVQ